jgi:hypothetical protein
MNEVVENVVVETAETKKAKVSNIVAFPDGNIDFGANGKSVSYYDVPSRTLTFKVVTGEVIPYTLTEEEAAGLSDNVIEHILYARQEKIKSTLAPIKAVLTPEEIKDGKLNVAMKIRKELAALAAGEFVTRSTAGGNVALDEWLQAWAIVNAYGAVFLAGKVEEANQNRFPVSLVKWEHSSSLIFGAPKPEWANVNDVQVIADVLETWKGLSREAKAEQKRSNTFVSTQALQIEQGIVTI